MLSPGMAWVICAAAAAGGVAIVKALFSDLIFKLYAFGLTIGGPLYSVPPLQLKRFPLLAGLTIACCRGAPAPFGRG